MALDKSSWYKPRNYLHFDSPISQDQAYSLVTSPGNIVKHSFYPFLFYKLSAPKLKKSKNGKLERSVKERGISYASHKDSHIFSYYAYILNEKYESLLRKDRKYQKLFDSILAFRQLGKSNIDFAKFAFDMVHEKVHEYEECTVLALDITSFFDHLDHDILKKMWSIVLGEPKLPDHHYAVFRAITRFSRVDREEVFNFFNISANNPRKDKRNRICSPIEFRKFRKSRKYTLFNNFPAFFINKDKKGIPQGSPISALLSNIYMLDFDLRIHEKVTKMNGIYLRYCDDILCIIPSKDVDEIYKYIREEIHNQLKLTINESKTEIIYFSYNKRKNKIVNDKYLQYLGFILHNGSISIRSAAFCRYSNKMKRGVDLAKQTQRKYNLIRDKKGIKNKKLYKKKLYSRYSHFGKCNFISYGKRASEKMSSIKIAKQLKPLWLRLRKEIHNTPDS
ncbi:reverse transcriptase/maturase family protein [Actinobacillus equuli subsp. haemolyticus]|nr:reverse transcriptase/maturase family protein [Actinobacillus equuli subsp. haemolyticus]WGE87378.1 reverse transcriptase/maturase family protein [Actinobacillus equuli subsp. haemolyticus]